MSTQRFCRKNWIVLLLLWIAHAIGFGCSTPTRSWVYPTQDEQEASLICNQVYNPEYAAFTVNSRLSSISRFIVLENQILAFFNDGNRVILPIETDLPAGEEFPCGARLKNYPCILGTNEGSNCSRKHL
ncbi:MAG: hypothetical protein HQM14_01765 [SAR324 cluster bacterium]|nr:hypothetical protein [SAR324 cluster bacterium]